MTFELDDADFDLLLLALGIATGHSWDHNKKLAIRLIQLANTINKDNPNWTPYEGFK